MKKKILIGSLLVLTLLLLMPSIPAIQQKTVEGGFKQDLQEKLGAINIDDLKDIEVLDGIRHPILLRFVLIYLYIQVLKFDINTIWLVIFCLDWDELGSSIDYNIFYYIFSFRMEFSYFKASAWISFWKDISDRLRWNWNLPVIV